MQKILYLSLTIFTSTIYGMHHSEHEELQTAIRAVELCMQAKKELDLRVRPAVLYNNIHRLPVNSPASVPEAFKKNSDFDRNCELAAQKVTELMSQIYSQSSGLK